MKKLILLKILILLSLITLLPSIVYSSDLSETQKQQYTISWYTFDGTLNGTDSNPFNPGRYNLQASGNLIGTINQNNQTNKAVYFDGSGDYFNKTIPFNNLMTFIFWANISITDVELFWADNGVNDFKTQIQTNKLRFSNDDVSIDSTTSVVNAGYMCNALVINGSTSSIYLNGKLNTSGSIPTDWTGLRNLYIGRTGAGTREFIGKLSDLLIMNTSLSAADILEICTSSIYDYLYIPLDNTLQVYTYDTFDLTPLNATIIITNGSYYNSSNTSAGSFIFYGVQGLYNISVININYNPQFFENFNISDDLTSYLYPYFKLINYTYSNYKTYGLDNYVRNLTYSINYTCFPGYNTTIDLYINKSIYKYINLTCDNSSKIYTSNHINQFENLYNISFLMNTSYYPNYNTKFTGTNNFISDLYNPNISLSYIFPAGFTQVYFNITLICNDTILNQSQYLSKINSNTLFYANKSRGTIITNQTYLGLTTNNIIFGSCSDLFGSTNLTLTKTLFFKNITLIDEINGSYFDLNCTSAIIYFDDNRTSYDFKAHNSYRANFTSDNTSKLRIELGYSDGSIINRYLDTNLIDSGELRVCANREGISHYEQLIISSSVKPAILKSVYSDCIVASDYTRFGYQSTKLLKAFTIDRLYYLYTFDSNDNQVLLSSVDGSVQSYMNLDTLEFQSQGYNINVLKDVLTFKEILNNVVFYYRNLANNNQALNLKIINLDTHEIVLNTNSFTNPNNFTLYFDYTTLPNVTNKTIFSAEINRTLRDGTTESFKRYFNIMGRSGILKAEYILIISILLSLFGLTFTAARTTFSWFGIVISLLNIAFLSFAVSVWYITLLFAINIIILIYIILIMIKQNYPTISG